MIDGVPHLVDCETSMREDGLPCGCITHDVVEAIMSSLSDHDRAVAADALRQAADDLIEAFPQTFRGEDGHLSARMYSSGEYAEWLRARAEAVGDDD